MTKILSREEKSKIRLESYNDPRPSTNQSTSLKSGLNLWSVCLVLYVLTYVRTYGRMDVWTDTINRNNEPLFKLVLWFVLGSGSKNMRIDLRCRSTATAESDHYFHIGCTSVRPPVPKIQNQAKITASRDCGLAEWIIEKSMSKFKFLRIVNYKHRL